MNPLIERMKLNKIPYGLLSEEEKECLASIGRSNIEKYCVTGEWLEAADNSLYLTATYRIRPDYQEPKPAKRIVEVAVDPNGGRVSFVRDNCTCPINAAVNFPNFAGYKYADGSVRIDPRRYDAGAYMIPTHVLFVE